jgi:DNA polymerase IV
MDAFYASIEQRDNPKLRGKPVVVGDPPPARSVVSTCSYEARRYGIHSAMSCWRAQQLCPDIIFVSPRFDAYMHVSRQIHAIFARYTDIIEPIACDEAYLDVTENKQGCKYATIIAQDICSTIHRELNLTASAGVSFNKFLAKIASDMRKPAGITVIPPGEEESIINSLPIERFYGVGAATAAKMRAMGIECGADIKSKTLGELEKAFGKRGEFYYNIAYGRDFRMVNPSRERKSYGKETTFSYDIVDEGKIYEAFSTLTHSLEGTLMAQDVWVKTVTVKIRYEDFSTYTRCMTLPLATQGYDDIMRAAERLWRRFPHPGKPVRLLGVALSNLAKKPATPPVVQLEFAF